MRGSHLRKICMWDLRFLGVWGKDLHVSVETCGSQSTEKRSLRSACFGFGWPDRISPTISTFTKAPDNLNTAKTCFFQAIINSWQCTIINAPSFCSRLRPLAIRSHLWHRPSLARVGCHDMSMLQWFVVQQVVLRRQHGQRSIWWLSPRGRGARKEWHQSHSARQTLHPSSLSSQLEDENGGRCCSWCWRASWSTPSCWHQPWQL